MDRATEWAIAIDEMPSRSIARCSANGRRAAITGTARRMD